MLPQLNQAELALLNKVGSGESVELPQNHCHVRSSVFRHLVLQLADPQIPGSVSKTRNPRWIIRGAVFDSRIDFRDARSQNDGPIAALEFVNCTFTDGFDGDGGHFDRLRFASCRFHYRKPSTEPHATPRTPISLRNVIVVGELRLKDIHPDDEHPWMWLYGRGLRVGTNVRLENVHLRAPQQEEVRQDGSTRYALDLDGSQIGGHLKLHPNVVLDGGLRLQNASIEGNFWAEGLAASDGETAQTRKNLLRLAKTRRMALDAQSAHIRGELVLRAYARDGKHCCSIVGNTWLWGIQVSGGVFLDGITVPPVPVAGDPLPLQKTDEAPEGDIPPTAVSDYGSSSQLELGYSSIGGAFSMGIVELPVELVRPSVSGTASLYGAAIHGPVTIEADLGALLLEGANIDGNLELAGFVGGIEASRMKVGGDAKISPTLLEPRVANFRRSSFDGLLDISLLEFKRQPTPALGPPQMAMLSLRGIRAARALVALPYPPVFESAKRIQLDCWPGHWIIEVKVRKNPDSDEVRQAWSYVGVAYATFLLCAQTRLAAAITGASLRHADSSVPTPMQSMAKAAIARMDLSSDAVVLDYVRLFCACLSTDDTDFFSVVEKQEHLPRSLRDKIQLEELQVLPRQASSEPTVVRCVGHLRARGHVSKVTFKLTADGLVVVEFEKVELNDEVEDQRHYEWPYRYGADAERSDYSPLTRGEEISRVELEKTIPNWKELLTSAGRFADARIDLRDASCVTLQDDGGGAWIDAKLLLENFTYARLASTIATGDASSLEVTRRTAFLDQRPSDEFFQLQIFARRFLEALPHFKNKPGVNQQLLHQASTEIGSWLAASHGTLVRDLHFEHTKRFLENIGAQQVMPWLSVILNSTSSVQENFQPQPYTQVAKVLREQGDEDAAREIEKEKIRLQLGIKISSSREALGKAIRSFDWSLHSVLVFIARALEWSSRSAWRVIYGSGFGYGLNLRRAALTLVLCWALGWLGVAIINREGYLIETVSPVASVIAKSESGYVPVMQESSQAHVEDLPCGGSVNQLLYAIETFTPLINLRQESRCEIRSPKSGDRFLIPRELEFVKFLYELLGYITTSLAVLTFSGLARRWDQD